MLTNRRTLLSASIAIASGAPYALGARAEERVDAQGITRKALNEPAVALETYLKLRGSTQTETVFRPYDGDVFQVQDGEVGKPLCGVRGIQKSHWRKNPDGSFSNDDYDIGYYVDFETREPLSLWTNPFTGRKVQAQPYRSGPSGGRFIAGQKSTDVYSDPIEGRWSILGSQISHTSIRSAEIKNPLTPEAYPLASVGRTFQVAMSTTFLGDRQEVASPSVHSAMSTMVWTDLTSWEPWMEMGMLRGQVLWRLIGPKVFHPAEIDPVLVSEVERVFPGYVHADAVWGGPNISGYQEYMRTHRPQT